MKWCCSKCGKHNEFFAGWKRFRCCHCGCDHSDHDQYIVDYNGNAIWNKPYIPLIILDIGDEIDEI